MRRPLDPQTGLFAWGLAALVRSKSGMRGIRTREDASCPSGFKSMRGSLSLTAPTSTFSIPTRCIDRDHLAPDAADPFCQSDDGVAQGRLLGGNDAFSPAVYDSAAHVPAGANMRPLRACAHISPRACVMQGPADLAALVEALLVRRPRPAGKGH